MRRILLLAGMMVSLTAVPAWGGEDMNNEQGEGMHYECVSGKLQATRGQIFNANVVPFDEPVRVCATIVRPKQPGFFGAPASLIAGRSCGIATSRMPFQLDTKPTTDNAVEAYARLRIWVPKRPPMPCKRCPSYQAAVKTPPPTCDDGKCGPPMPPPPPMVPAASIFRLGSDNHINDGTNATTDIICRPAMERARRVWTEEVDILED